MSSRTTAFVLVLATAALFSTGGAAVKAATLSGWQVASLRSGIAVLTLIVIMPSSRRRWGWRTLGTGCAYAATMILFVHANKLTTAANTIFLQATAPLYIAVLGPWLLREPIRRHDLALLVAFAAGLGLCFVGGEPQGASAPSPGRGNVFGALAGLSYALTLIGMRAAERASPEAGGGAGSAVLCGNVLACLFALPWAVPIEGLGVSDAGAVLYLGVFQVAVAYVLLTAALRRLKALEASLLLLLEPILNPLWAWLLHGERPGLWPLVGGGVILSATALKARLEIRGSPPESLTSSGV